MNGPSLDMQLAARLRPHLAPAETLVWVGAPSPGRYLRGSGLNVVGGLLIGWLALGLLAQALGEADALGRLAAAFFGLNAGGASLYLLGRAGLAFLRGQCMVYGVTDARALLLYDGRPQRLFAYGPAQLGAPAAARAGSGTFDVFFADDPAAVPFMAPTGVFGRPAPEARVGFLGIPANDRARAALDALGTGERPDAERERPSGGR